MGLVPHFSDTPLPDLQHGVRSAWLPTTHNMFNLTVSYISRCKKILPHLTDLSLPCRPVVLPFCVHKNHLGTLLKIHLSGALPPGIKYQ